MIFRVSSAHEEAGDRVYAVSTQEFLGNGDGQVRALRLVDVVFEGGRPVDFAFQQRAQHLSGARDPRSHGANRHPQDLRCFVVAHAFEPDQQDYPALDLRQFFDRLLDIEKVEAGARLGLRECKRRAGDDLLVLFAHQAADAIDIQVVEHSEKPHPQIAARLPKMLLRKRTHEAALHEIIRLPDISGQRPRITP